MIVLGIVGSPAGGKSTVASHLQDLGATWINADQIARGVLEEDEVQRALLRYFGPEIAGSDGRVDRAKLADRVFGDDAPKQLALTYLEGLVHPRTRRLITEKLFASERAGQAVAVLDVPLLFEVGWDRCCDEIWCIDADREIRLRRAEARGWDDSQLRAREASQIRMEEKKRLSTAVIMNNGSLQELHETIDQLWRSLVERQLRRGTDSHCFNSNLAS